MENRRTRLIGLEVLKWAVVVLTMVFLYTIAFRRGSVISVPFDEVAQKVTSVAVLDETEEGSNQMIKRLYGLEPSEYEGMLFLCPTSNMGAQELLLVRLSSLDQQDTVAAAMEARAKAQMDVFDGYAPTQYGILEKSVIEVQGNYILFISAADTAPYRGAFLDALK